MQITAWSADVDQRSAVAKAALARLRFAGAVSVGGDEGLMARLVSAAGSGAAAEVEAARAVEPAPSGGMLPFTGGGAVLGIAAIALIVAGLAMMQLRRRWSPSA